MISEIKLRSLRSYYGGSWSILLSITNPFFLEWLSQKLEHPLLQIWPEVEVRLGVSHPYGVLWEFLGIRTPGLRPNKRNPKVLFVTPFKQALESNKFICHMNMVKNDWLTKRARTNSFMILKVSLLNQNWDYYKATKYALSFIIKKEKLTF